MRPPVWRDGGATPHRNSSTPPQRPGSRVSYPDVHVTCLDPGLMLGTGLSRQYPPVARRLTTLLARALGAVLPFASTPQASGRALARLLLDNPAPAASGAYVDHRLRTVPASDRAQDPGFQTEVLRDSRALLTHAADQ